MYTYKCGAMGWSGDGVIGYNGGSPTDYFFVHPLSGSDDAQTIACLEFPNSEWSNVLYNISIDNVVTVGPPVIDEPGNIFIHRLFLLIIISATCMNTFSPICISLYLLHPRIFCDINFADIIIIIIIDD